MKNLLKCSSLIGVAVFIVVMVFMASQVTCTYANGTAGGGKGSPQDVCCEGITPYERVYDLDTEGTDEASVQFTIPTGKLLILEYVTARVIRPGGAALRPRIAIVTHNTAANTDIEHDITPTEWQEFEEEDKWTRHAFPVTLYSDTVVTVVVRNPLTVNFVLFDGTLTGRLVNLN